MMETEPSMPVEGNAIVFCEGAFATTYGKTAHGLVRFTRRYRIMSIVDSQCAGQDAGRLLDGAANGMPIHASLTDALAHCKTCGAGATHMVVGLATDGGKLTNEARQAVAQALELGLNVDCGLHEFISDDPEMIHLAEASGAVMRDIRKPPPRDQLHFFNGRIDEVQALKVAVLGTDSAVGKRTTAWRIVQGFEAMGRAAELVGTGQTAWLQGARYGLVLDALVNDFVAGEIEHAVWRAWNERNPDVIVIEGQGSLMNPAYPGGFEIMAAARPDAIVLQHAPARKDYDGFAGHRVHSLGDQIQAVELLGGKPVVALTINHENIAEKQRDTVCQAIEMVTGLPTIDVLEHGAERLVHVLQNHLPNAKKAVHT
jgi:uncharacterized NAD-dependent epimerase/dehydratase family protein